MKKCVFVLAIIVGLLGGYQTEAAKRKVSSSSSGPAEIDIDALSALIEKNPSVEMADTGQRKLHLILAEFMTSYFDEKGQGALSVALNNCKIDTNSPTQYNCTLNINNKGMKKKGSNYVQTKYSTESGVHINYRVEAKENGVFVIGKVTGFAAG